MACANELRHDEGSIFTMVDPKNICNKSPRNRVEEAWQDSDSMCEENFRCLFNNILLKNVWSADNSEFLNEQGVLRVRCQMVKEISIRPLIVPVLASLKNAQSYPSPLMGRTHPLNQNFVGADETLIEVLNMQSERALREGVEYYQWIRAGPRKTIKFNTTEVVAAIVTCGGLCPGLNNVIREITSTLIRTYGVKKVYGIPFGYKGFYSHEWKVLDLSVVRHIHKNGGTMLGTSRGGFDATKIVDSLVEKGVNQLYVIGGDGTHRGANVINQEAVRRGLVLTVAGVPKTIDNDIAFIDRSFGFDTAVEEAVKTIGCALTEALNVEDGIGIVKVMGRDCGFVALHATVAAGDVDICLIPEVPFDLDALFQHVQHLLDTQGHCLIVVAEGAGQEHLLDKDLGADASGNRRLPDIGQFLREQAQGWFHTRGRRVCIRYMDPSYQIRSVRAIAPDSIYCARLASNVVHGAMAGYSGFSCGQVNTQYVYIPIETMCEPARQVRVPPCGRMYLRMLRGTMQPSFTPSPAASKPPPICTCSPAAAAVPPAESESAHAACLDNPTAAMRAESADAHTACGGGADPAAPATPAAPAPPADAHGAACGGGDAGCCPAGPPPAGPRRRVAPRVAEDGEGDGDDDDSPREVRQ